MDDMKWLEIYKKEVLPYINNEVTQFEGDIKKLVGIVERQNERVKELEYKDEVLGDLVKEWNDHAKNGTEQEKAEFFEVFRRVIITKHYDKSQT